MLRCGRAAPRAPGARRHRGPAQCRLPRVPDTVAAVEISELADLIWLFEDEPASDCREAWPVGLQSFRLRRADREVLFSLDPLASDAYISLYVTGSAPRLVATWTPVVEVA